MRVEHHPVYYLLSIYSYFLFSDEEGQVDNFGRVPWSSVTTRLLFIGCHGGGGQRSILKYPGYTENP